ncbi:response regulator [candidate division CSSED10-310 bacterium]|uniref:Response regulator n=1 Tax=candidate division CSSED10-310 bacterium TaxID=2855610 RepID=A0ABV6YVA1_UNCC1
MAEKTTYVLAVDDDVHVLRTLKAIVKEFGMTPLLAENVPEALTILKEYPIDIILTDMIMPEIDGLAFIDIVKNTYPTIPIAVLSAYGSISDTVAALSKGAYNFIPKPFSVEGIKAIIEKGLRLRKLSLNTDVLSGYITNETRFEFPNDPNLFPAIQYYLVKECQWRGIEEDSLLTNISICLDETLMNAYVHGNQEDEQRKIKLSAHFSNHILSISVQDEGAGFDSSSIITEVEKLDPLTMNNKGLFIVQNIVERIEFNDSGNEIRFFFSY